LGWLLAIPFILLGAFLFSLTIDDMKYRSYNSNNYRIWMFF